MKRYETYKDSGVEWIGNIPSAWDVVEIKTYCDKIFAGATPSTGNQDFWDGDIPWIPSGCCQYKNIETAPKFITQLGFENSSTKLIPANTTVMAMTGATCANVGYLTFESCANQSVAAFVENKSKAISRYLFYLLWAARDYILIFQTGGAQAGINIMDCCNFKVPFLPPSEQQAIAAYLDEKCEAIDAKVSALEKQKDAYARLKKSIINRAVTHGLNNDVEFKDSGVDWIGKIPKNWNLRRIKELGTMGAGSTPKSGNDKYYDDGTHPWLNTGDVQNCIISSPQNFITDLAVSECNMKYFTSGSVLVAMYGGGTIGNVGLLTFDSTVNQACCTISPYKFVYNKYLFYSLMAHREKLISFGGGGTQVNLSQGTIGNFIVGLPPYEEQHAIADYLDAKCSDIDNRIEVIDKTTEKYKALKKSLISEVVTGKRCVI